MKLPFLMVGLSCCLFAAQAWGDALPGPGPAPNAPPRRGAPNVGELKSEKITLNFSVKQADLKGEGENVRAKLVIPARLRELPPPAGAPGKVGLQETSPRSLVAAVALSLAAVSVVFVIRGKQLNTASKGAILGITVVVASFAVAYGNAGPPRNFGPKPEPPKLDASKDQIVIEFSADATEAVLTLSRAP